MALQIKFDPRQEYQINAVESVVRLFDGLSKRETEFGLGDEIVANLPGGTLDEEWLFDNLCTVQQDKTLHSDREIEGDVQLVYDQGLVIEGAGPETWRLPHFTVEMETGTGKTYV